MQSPRQMLRGASHASHVSATLSAPHRTSVGDTGAFTSFGASAENSACSFARFTKEAVASSPRNGRNQEARVDPPRAIPPSRTRRPPEPHEQGGARPPASAPRL